MKSNKGYIIAIIKSRDQSEPTGYKVWYNNSTKIVPGYILHNLMAKSDCVVNAEIKDGKIAGSNGSLDRYGIVTKDDIILKNALVITKKIGLTDRRGQVNKTVYSLVDTNGTTEICSAEQAIDYAEKIGLANGKVVTKGEAKFISAISGEYAYEEVLDDIFYIEYELGNNTEEQDGSERSRKNRKARETTVKTIPDVIQAFNRGVESELSRRDIQSNAIRAQADPNDSTSPIVDALRQVIKLGKKEHEIRYSINLYKETDGANRVLGLSGYFDEQGRLLKTLDTFENYFTDNQLYMTSWAQFKRVGIDLAYNTSVIVEKEIKAYKRASLINKGKALLRIGKNNH